MLQNRGLELARQGIERVGYALATAAVAIKDRTCKVFPFCSCLSRKADDIEMVLPVSQPCAPTSLNHSNNTSKAGSTNMASTYGRKSSENVLALQTQSLGPVPGSPRSPSIVSEEKSPESESMPFPLPNPATVSAGKQRWREAIRAVRIRAGITDSSASPLMGTDKEPMRRRTTSSERRANSQPKGTIAKSRLAFLVPKLKALEATQDLAAHTALVKHLQFSPDGKYLATSRFVDNVFSLEPHLILC